MLLRSVVFLLVITILTLTNCKDNSTNPDDGSQANDIMPLKIGNYWVYQMQDDNTITRDTLIITYKKEINGEIWYSWNGNYLKNDKDGLWMIDPDEANQSPVLVLKYPGKEGDQWTVSENEKTKILSTDTSVKVLGKTYSHCYLYEDKNFENNKLTEIAKIYVKPGIGIVKIDDYNNANVLQNVTLLISYKIN